MIYAPARGIWQPSRELLASLSLRQWEQGMRPWHRDPAWRPGRQWCPSRERAARMHALGIIFPGPAFIRRGGDQIGTGAGSGTPPGPSIATPDAFWRLEEASGTRADSTSSGVTWSPQNSPGNATGKVGSCLSLVAASSQFLQNSANGTVLAVGSGVSFTICAWIQPQTIGAGFQYVIQKTDTTFAAGWAIGYNSSAYSFLAGNGSVQQLNFSGVTPTVGTWAFLLARYDASNKTMYARVNNGSDATKVLSTDPGNGIQTAKMGARSDGLIVSGEYIDAAGWWRSKVSDTDAASLYNGTGVAAGTEWTGAAWS